MEVVPRPQVRHPARLGRAVGTVHMAARWVVVVPRPQVHHPVLLCRAVGTVPMVARWVVVAPRLRHPALLVRAAMQNGTCPMRVAANHHLHPDTLLMKGIPRHPSPFPSL